MPNGVVPGAGVQALWLTLLGSNRGRYFLLTGERISAKEALRVGIVGEVLPAKDIVTRAHELAQALATNNSEVLRHTRRVLIRSLRHRMRDELDSV